MGEEESTKCRIQERSSMALQFAPCNFVGHLQSKSFLIQTQYTVSEFGTKNVEEKKSQS